MSRDKKPSTSGAAFSSAEEAHRAQGPVGRIPREEFDKRLADGDVRETLDRARQMWRELYGRDPVELRSE